MPKYICDDCGKEFDHKSNYERHRNRTYKCTAVSDYKQRKMRKEQKEKELILKIEEKIKSKLSEEIEEKIKREMNVIIDDKLKNIEKTTNNILNNTITDNSTNNTNINLLNYVAKEYPNARNFEDCFNKNNITEEIKKNCEGQYYYDGATYLLTELCDIGESKRPIHCADISRKHFLVKKSGVWEKDLGGEKLKKEIGPVIDSMYHDFYLKRYEKNRDVKERLENEEFLMMETRNKRLNKILEKTASYFTVKKTQK
jgi:hypothetical protein